MVWIVPANGARRGRHIHHDQLFLWIDPPVSTAGTGPGELPDRPHHFDYTGRCANGKSRAETVIGAGRIGIADEIVDIRAQLIRQHVRDGSRPKQAGFAGASLIAFKVSPIRASLSLDIPTSSGLARGGGSAARATPEAKRQSEVASNRRLVPHDFPKFVKVGAAE
jgi:hypothetical protein